MRRLTLTLCLAGLLAACASDDGTPVSSEEYDDLALSLGSQIAMHGTDGELGALADITQLVAGETPDGCAEEGRGTYHGERGGLDYRYKLSCWDGSGARLAHCDATTDRASIHVELKGAASLPGVQLAIDRTGDWELHGLSSTRPRLAGTSDAIADAVIANPDRGVTATYHLVTSGDFQNIVEKGVPTTGNVHYTLSVDLSRETANRTHERSFEVDARVTFRTDGHAVIDLDGVRRYDLDLATGVVIRLT